METTSKAAIENKLRIAHLHLKNANERKSSKPMGNEDEIIAMCQAQIKDFTNQLHEQSTI